MATAFTGGLMRATESDGFWVCRSDDESHTQKRKAWSPTLAALSGSLGLRRVVANIALIEQEVHGQRESHPDVPYVASRWRVDRDLLGTTSREPR